MSDEVDSRPIKRRRAIPAFLASLLFPPTGHFYAGNWRRGLVIWLIAVPLPLLAMLAITYIPSKPADIIVSAAILACVLIQPIDATITARRAPVDYRLQSFNRWYIYLFAFILAQAAILSIALSFRAVWLEAFVLPTDSMKPLLVVGDRFVTDKLVYRWRDPKRFEVVVFRPSHLPTQVWVKRVIGRPRESVAIQNDKVIIDGQPIDEPYAYFEGAPPRMPQVSNFGPITLGADEYFLMGDNRYRAYDSRFLGPVNRSRIFGLARVIYASKPRKTDDVSQKYRDRSIRWERMGRRLDAVTP